MTLMAAVVAVAALALVVATSDRSGAPRAESIVSVPDPQAKFLGDWEIVQSRPSPDSKDLDADRAAISLALEQIRKSGIYLRVLVSGKASGVDGSARAFMEYTWTVVADEVAEFKLLSARGKPPERPYSFTVVAKADGSLEWTEGAGSAVLGSVHTLVRRR